MTFARFRFVSFVALFVLAACRAENDSPEFGVRTVSGTVEPNAVTAFGHELLTVTLDEPLFASELPAITVDGYAVYDIEKVDARTVKFRWQGSEREVTHIDFEGNERVRLANALQVKQPEHPAFRRMVSIGASFSQGVQSAGFDQDTAMTAPAAQVARQAGAYFPMPLTKRGYIPFLEPQEFDEGGSDDPCKGPDLTTKEVYNLNHALSGFRNLEGRLSPSAILVDPAVKSQNAAVGGSILTGVVKGAEAAEMPILTLLEHLMYDPVDTWEGMLRTPEVGSQLDYILTLAPTLVMTVDIGGNDVLPALRNYDVARIPDDAYWRDHYRELFSRLGPDVYVFIADLPDITLLPDERIKRANRIAGGQPQEEVDAKLDAIRKRLGEVNAILAKEAASYPRVTIVPFSKLVDDLSGTGLVAAGQQLTFGNFGGFISLDGLHLSQTGYGVLANEFIQSMNKKLGTQIPLIDVDRLVETDRYSPANLAPYGLTVTACPTP